jgi:adenosylmethionine---8-amino-7-oxononanoate aminotransferase
MADKPWGDLLTFDRNHIWHPYAPLPSPRGALPVVAAEGTRLRLADGVELIDGMSSWWSAVHGHRHPAIVAALVEQLGTLPHVMFGGLTHEPAIQLARQLVELAPHGVDRVFFADSGSVAVEVALKLCIQRAAGLGHPARTRMLTIRGGYHGDTLGAMSVCDPERGMHRMYSGMLAQQVFAPRPPRGFDAGLDQEWASAVERLVAEHAQELAGIIVEPVLQGAGGMHVYSPECLRHLRALCDAYDLLLVADEIATGFGRTGAMFACEHADIAPDVMCVGKALTGGVMSLAATLTTADVAAAVGDSEPGALMHGPTFMANPLACAAALASTALLTSRGWHGDVQRIQSELMAGLEPARALPTVLDVRTLGAVGVVQLRQAVDVARATRAAIEEGVWLRPFGDLVYTMPPYTCDDAEVATIGRAVVAAVVAAAA